MQKTVSYTLTLLLLVGQTFCFAHSHEDLGTSGHEGHSQRNHIHVHFGHHHHHGDHLHRESEDLKGSASGILAEEMPLDHDADAIYLSPEKLFREVRIAGGDAAKLVGMIALQARTTTISDLNWGSRVRYQNMDAYRGCPIYLRTRCVRC